MSKKIMYTIIALIILCLIGYFIYSFISKKEIISNDGPFDPQNQYEILDTNILFEIIVPDKTYRLARDGKGVVAHLCLQALETKDQSIGPKRILTSVTSVVWQNCFLYADFGGEAPSTMELAPEGYVTLQSSSDFILVDIKTGKKFNHLTMPKIKDFDFIAHNKKSIEDYAKINPLTVGEFPMTLAQRRSDALKYIKMINPDFAIIKETNYSYGTLFTYGVDGIEAYKKASDINPKSSPILIHKDFSVYQSQGFFR